MTLGLFTIEAETFDRRLDEFMAEHPGEYVFIDGDVVRGFRPELGEAVAFAVRVTNRRAVYVRKVTRAPNVAFIPSVFA